MIAISNGKGNEIYSFYSLLASKTTSVVTDYSIFFINFAADNGNRTLKSIGQQLCPLSAESGRPRPGRPGRITMSATRHRTCASYAGRAS